MLGFPYIGPVEEVLSGPNARVLDVATVSSLVLRTRLTTGHGDVSLSPRKRLINSWAIEMADMFPR